MMYDVRCAMLVYDVGVRCVHMYSMRACVLK